MRIKSSRLPLLLPLLALVLRGADPTPSPETAGITIEFVDQLVLEAQGHNPALAAVGARADAASASIDSVRTWDDPTLTIGLSKPAPRGFKSEEEGNILYGIDQKLPVFGRPGLMKHVAEAEAAKERLNVNYETQRLRRDLTVALVELALADKSIDLAQQDLGWLEAMLGTVDHRYQTGKSSQVEWLKIQTEQAKAVDHLKTLKLARDQQQVELNRLLNRDLRASWPGVDLPAIQPAVPYTDELAEAAVQSEPKLKVMQQEVVQAEAATQLTRRQRLPEIGVGLQAHQYSGDGGIREGMLTVNFTVPWFNASRYDSDFRRDQARARASENEAADYTLALRTELHRLTTGLDAARRQALLYRDEIIPLTEQTLTSARAAWENNLGLLQDVLDARRMLVDNRLILVQSTAEQVRQLADLTLLTGMKDFPALASVVEPAKKPKASGDPQ